MEVGDVPIRVDTRKAVALLAYLAVRGEHQNRDSLAGLLWPDYPQARARAALRRTLSTLKRALGGRWLVAEGEDISLDRGGLLLDVDAFRQLVASCGGHGHPAWATCRRCLEPLERAVALHRGDFMAGFALRDSVEFDGWQLFQAEALRRERAGALERLVGALTDVGDLERAIVRTREWLRLDPLHEAAHQRLMVLLAWSGDRAGALRQYRECVGVLDRELRVAPLQETTDLSHAIEDERLPPPAPREEAPPAVGEAPKPPRSRWAYPLVGRSEELVALLSAWRGTGRDGSFLVVEGEAGIGKTRLGEEFLAAAGSEGGISVAVRCYEEERDLAYGTMARALRGVLAQIGADRARDVDLIEVGRLVPEAAEVRPGLPTPRPLGDAGARVRFLDAVSEVLLGALEGDPAGILFLDDLHWADEASLEALAHVVRRLEGRPACIVATWRREEVPAEHRLRRLLGDSRRRGLAASVGLSRLTPADVAELVAAARPEEAPEELARRLYRETEGVPFFLVEYLSSAGGPAMQGERVLPGGVRELLEARLSPVSERARQVLSAAAAIGRSFDPDTVRAASGRSEEEVAAALEELVARGLIHEPVGPEGAGYDFSHPKLREFAYEGTGLARRRLLHRRIAKTLARRVLTDPSASSVVARHYQLAGLEEEAAVHFRAAGEHARRVFANAEALSHFESALALGHPDAAGLHRAIGDLRTLMGEYRAALASYEAAAALCSSDALPSIEHRLGGVYLRLGEWASAEARFEAALATVRDEDVGLRARVLADRSLVAHRAGRGREAKDLALRSLSSARRGGDDAALAQAHNLLGMLAKAAGDLDESRSHLERSLEIAEELRDGGARVAALNNLALVARAAGDHERALELTREALRLAVERGDRHREAALTNNLADVWHLMGRSQEAMEHLKRAVAIFAEVGEEAGGPYPEIWKLVEW